MSTHLPFSFSPKSLATRFLAISLAMVSVSTHAVSAEEWDSGVRPFLGRHCADCHAEGADEGGFELSQLGDDLTDSAQFARWEQVYDRVARGEMPPADSDQPTEGQKRDFRVALSRPLAEAHAAEKATVLRRLNRREYQNTLNDLFGTNLDLERMLPEDARSHEFDNVGEALGLSDVHLRRYIDAARAVLDAAIEDFAEPPKVEVLSAWYKDSREAEKHVGKAWKLLDDGYVVRFEGGGYPSGMLRGSSVRKPGRYRIEITGYAHQSEQPITFSVGGVSFARGSEKPIYGFYEFPPGQPTTIELEAWIDERYMIAIEPYGIFDPGRYKRDSVEEYGGPGLAIGEVKLEGPMVDQFPCRGHQMIFEGLDRTEIEPSNPSVRTKSWYRPEFEVRTENARDDGRQVLARVADKLFRRPSSTEELQPYHQLLESQLEQGESLESSLKTAIAAMLCSPRFLFLQEPLGELDSYAIASRLSYLFTRSSPDEVLLSRASRDELARKEVLRKETIRLMADEKFDRFIRDFTDSWLDLREIDFTAPDAKLFPEYDSFLRDSMIKETHAFVREMFDSNLPIRNLVKSDFAMLNRRLAEHYELPLVDSVEIQKVTLPSGSVRGGLLSQASVLKVTANGTNSSPVTRGVWVLERLLGQTPPPPPPGIPGVEPDIRGATTLRELLDKHRDSDNCRSCHSQIDPPGFALEAFNPIGGYRERYRSLGNGDRPERQVRGRRVGYRLGLPVDASGEFGSGASFANFVEFRDQLSKQDARLAKAFVTKLLTFATGRHMGFSDRPEINRIVQDAAKEGYRTTDLLHAVIASHLFQTK
ncbi:MAG: DUF1592 domain-containing protein [Planctomycetota bacterium]